MNFAAIQKPVDNNLITSLCFRDPSRLLRPPSLALPNDCSHSYHCTPMQIIASRLQGAASQDPLDPIGSDPGSHKIIACLACLAFQANQHAASRGTWTEQEHSLPLQFPQGRCGRQQHKAQGPWQIQPAGAKWHRANVEESEKGATMQENISCRSDNLI